MEDGSAGSSDSTELIAFGGRPSSTSKEFRRME